MKKLLFAVTLTALLVSVSAFAQMTWQDNIGIYLDEAGANYCQDLAPGFYPAYLVLTGLTSETVGGWEAKITSSGAGEFTAVNPRGTYIDAGTKTDEYIIGLGIPMPAVGGTCVIADLTFGLSSADPFYGFVGPIYWDSLENGLPAYLDGADQSIIKRLVPRIGQVSDAQLLINDPVCGGVVANEDASFGAVKALFR